MSKEDRRGFRIMIEFLVILFFLVYGCSVIFVKGDDNAITEQDYYKLRHKRSIDIGKDTINIKKDTVWD